MAFPQKSSWVVLVVVLPTLLLYAVLLVPQLLEQPVGEVAGCGRCSSPSSASSWPTSSATSWRPMSEPGALRPLLVELAARPDAAPAADLVRSAGRVVSDQLFGIPFALGDRDVLPPPPPAPARAAMAVRLGPGRRCAPPPGAPGSTFGLPLAPLMAVLAVQEMALAVWLLARGLR
jgi:hypothetical protein